MKQHIRKSLHLALYIVVCASTVFSLFSSIAHADSLPASELDGVNLYPNYVVSSSDCSSLTGAAGSGPLYGLDFPEVSDVGALVSAINNYIATTSPGSPLKGLGSDFVQSGQTYNINPALLVGIAFKESTLGLHTVNGSYDAFGLTADGDIPGAPFENGITYFPSWQASIDPTTKYISVTYVHGGYNATTILEMMDHYTPPNPELATNETLDVMQKILGGLSTTASGATDTAADNPTDTSSETAGCGTATTTSFTPGENGYDLTGTNAMAHFYQCNNVTAPYGTAPWANTEYGQAGTVCVGGCGITSLAMVVDTLAGVSETPGTLAQKYGAYGSTAGTVWSLWPVAAKAYNLTYTDLGTNFAAVDNIIHEGGLVIVAVNAGYFTSDSHLMVIRAVDNSGNFYLADPNGPRPADHPTETQGFSASFMLGQGNAIQLFAFTKGGA